MKKIISSILLLSCFAFANAQITLTANSFPAIGQMFMDHIDTLPSSVTTGPAGANQTWDFSALNSQFVDTSELVDPATTSSGAAFPTADVAGLQGGNYVYVVNTATESDFIGVSGYFNGAGPFILHYNHPNIIAKTGVTYNSSYNFYYDWDLWATGAAFGQPLADSIHIHNDTYVTKTVDGWGTVTTPLGSYACLRIKEVDSSHLVGDALVPLAGGWQYGVVDQNRISTTYSFMNDLSIEPIVELDMDSSQNNVAQTHYTSQWADGINNISKPALFTVYPNPNSGNEFHILVGGLKTGNYELNLFDVSGNLIATRTCSVNNATVTDEVFELKNLAAGNYVAVIASGAYSMQSIKISIVK